MYFPNIVDWSVCMSELKFSEFNSAIGRKRRFSDTPLDKLPLTMSYTPFQELDSTYNYNEALIRGTLFPELDKPFCGKFTGEKK